MLNIVDYTLVMAEGGVKNSAYHGSQFITAIQKVNDNQNFFTLATSKRAGNVQKGAQGIVAEFPIVSIIH